MHGGVCLGLKKCMLAQVTNGTPKQVAALEFEAVAFP